tara:strand:+ start:1263 stop:1427 length:165 start_codon:yes stop_codon:yes gene_type:complete
MIFTINLHPEVIKFLDQTGTIYFDNNGEKSYIVNGTMYKETNEEGLYTTQFIKN